MKWLFINWLALSVASQLFLADNAAASKPSNQLPWDGELSYWVDKELVHFTELEQAADWKQSKDGWIRSTFLDADYWLGFERARVWLKLDFAGANLPNKPTWLELSSLTVNHAEIFYMDESGQYAQASDHDTDSSFGHDLPTRRISMEIKPEWRQQPASHW